MNAIKKSIRPKIELKLASTENEQFQNEVLRPILKLQHDILLRLFMSYAYKQKTTVKELSTEKFIAFVDNHLQKNIIFRNQLVGVIIGQFTVEEYVEYSEKSSEFNKRILNMIKKRLSDSEALLKDL